MKVTLGSTGPNPASRGVSLPAFEAQAGRSSGKVRTSFTLEAGAARPRPSTAMASESSKTLAYAGGSRDQPHAEDRPELIA